MQKKAIKYLSVIKLIGFLILLYALCRLIFYAFYYHHFVDVGFLELIGIFIVGIRFDLSAIVLLNSLFIVFYLLPIKILDKPYFFRSLKWVFVVTNSLGLLANCVDFAYFGFTLKRTTADVFHFFSGEIGGDLGHLLPVFLKDYWYVFLIWIFFVFLLIKAYKRVMDIKKNDKELKSITAWLMYVVSILLSVAIYRGGLQLKPITIVDAGEYTNSRNIPLLLNTPFTIIKTLDIESIEPVIYFSDEAHILENYNPIHSPSGKEMNKQNVFIIVLESFSKEYIGSLNGKNKGYTPFLDSLMNYSYVFTDAYSNGKKSIEGIPSIIASIPTWMNEAYITSAYGGNQIKGLAQLLKDEGYYTAFFHGGVNGTMGFEAFSHVAGYKDYFGKNEYNSDKDYDGNWGIWDEAFLQYSIRIINEKKSPFLATLFTLSSHHPFAIPKKHENKFKGGKEPIFKTIEYTDYALKQFFESAKKMPWYNNTLFVFCADHTGPSNDIYFENKIGNNAIPIIFFQPDSFLKGRNNNIIQQIDIMPSILDYIHYNKSYFAFGKSAFDTTNYFSLSYNSGLYQYIEGDYAMQFDGQKTTELYNYKTDSLLKQNLIETNKAALTKMETKVKAIIQTYQQSLINNKMVAE